MNISTAANDPRPSVSFSALKNPQRIPANTPPVFPGARPRKDPYSRRGSKEGARVKAVNSGLS